MSEIKAISPATEELIAIYPLMNAGEEIAKLTACHNAFLEWHKRR